MSLAAPSPPGFWRVVRLLLAASVRRTVGRMRRQRALLRQRTGRTSTTWSVLPLLVVGALMFGLNVAAAFLVLRTVAASERIDARRRGMIVVEPWFMEWVTYAQEKSRYAADPDRRVEQILAPKYRQEAARLAHVSGGSADAIERRLRDAVALHRTDTLIREDAAGHGLASLPDARTVAAMLGSIALLWWGVMLAFQGEGLELDTLRQRHPIWEWLFSHPVPPSAVFLAEMLSPIAANPIYYSAPVLPGILYGSVYGTGGGIAAGLLVGVPLTVAAACIGKAIEIAVTLRFPPRSRGAMFGLISWVSYCSMMLLFFAFLFVDQAVPMLARALAPLTALPWPWLGVFLGRTGEGAFSFPLGVAACLGFAAVAIVGSVGFSVWGAQRGLAGASGRANPTRLAAPSRSTRFGKHPLYRKELLWFARDRSAIVQAILMPLTLASIQLFNFRGLVTHAHGSWNALCGVAILFGTYFLSVLGPKSLASEGAALWIALTWPRGLESLLKAKAQLWTLLSSAIVGVVLCFSVYLFPANVWKVALVGAGWVLFARSMAEKAVTLATVTSDFGRDAARAVRPARGGAARHADIRDRRADRQWALAVTGIVYSFVTAAAMWQNFRARLPYFYDPWSETLPQPPTLMHAMIAISVLVESGAIVTGIAAVFGPERMAVARAMITPSVPRWFRRELPNSCAGAACRWRRSGTGRARRYRPPPARRTGMLGRAAKFRCRRRFWRASCLGLQWGCSGAATSWRCTTSRTWRKASTGPRPNSPRSPICACRCWRWARWSRRSPRNSCSAACCSARSTGSGAAGARPRAAPRSSRSTTRSSPGCRCSRSVSPMRCCSRRPGGSRPRWRYTWSTISSCWAEALRVLSTRRCARPAFAYLARNRPAAAPLPPSARAGRSVRSGQETRRRHHVHVPENPSHDRRLHRAIRN